MEIVVCVDGTRITKEFDADGNVILTSTVTFYENGNASMNKTEFPDGSVVITYYDEDGNVIEAE